jgi:RNA polymerase sigma factor (TIGR02999 family)
VDEDRGRITHLLQAHRRGDRAAFDQLVPLVYDRMRRIARGQLARSGRGRTLDTTALVHEAYMQLAEETSVDWQGRTHFFAICARAMRRILVDYARERTALKRGGGVPNLSLDAEQLGAEQQAELVLAVDRAVERLAALSGRLVQVVECRYFAGMTEEETATALGSSLRTVQRDWMRAKAWLRKELT